MAQSQSCKLFEESSRPWYYWCTASTSTAHTQRAFWLHVWLKASNSVLSIEQTASSMLELQFTSALGQGIIQLPLTLITPIRIRIDLALY